MTGTALAAYEVAPAFDLEFTDHAGAVRSGPLTELWSTRFEEVSPARSFPSFRGQRNFPGLYYAATMDAHVGFESWAERDVAMMLDFDPGVAAFSSQPFWLIWTQDGRERRHAPDYYARLADGTGVVIDVRPDDRIGPADAETFATTERACGEVGWEFRRTAGPGGALAANVRWLAGYRHLRCYRADVAAGLMQAFAEKKPLMAGARDVGDPVAVLPVLYHLLWQHLLSTELREQLLEPGSIVTTMRKEVAG